MKVTDYIVEFIISKGVTDIFGYPGGVICHFIDSTTKYKDKIQAHTNYHEQASAFAACGYAQETGKIGVAYVTSGPGATNLITGIANAYFDSTPILFLTGQVDTYGLKGDLPVRQRGFQETDVVSIVSSISKYAVRIDDPTMIRYELEKAYEIAMSGNPGPVVIDLPADVQRTNVDEKMLKGYSSDTIEDPVEEKISLIIENINKSKRPCFLVGNGVKQSGMTKCLRKIIDSIGIPTVFSMPAFDTIPYSDIHNFGFIGANGHRYGNFVLGKSDLIITLGSRLDLKQVGNNRGEFAPNAKIIRIDIDEDSFKYPVHNDEICVSIDIKSLLPELLLNISRITCISKEWLEVCCVIKQELEGFDDETYTKLLRAFGERFPENIGVTADVGQSEVWVAQQLHVKEGQTVHISAGHGAMGYSLPAAIGTYYGKRKPVISFSGDGGIQMNIQELQYLSREQIPVHVVVLNNNSLGMIRGFQEANFEKNYSQTVEGRGYSAPDFEKIANAYQLQYTRISNENEIKQLDTINMDMPSIIEIMLPNETSLNPNFGRNGMVQDQRPYMDRALFEKLIKM